MLDLNQVSYQILPGLQELLERSAAGAGAPRVIELQPLSLAVRNGIVR